MLRLLSYLLLAGTVSGAERDWKEDYRRIWQNVAAQLSKSANYACTENIDRVYIKTSEPELACGGAAAVKREKSKQTMHDRLRLDVAVSENREIYSWHGQNNFTSDSVADVVSTGPISSGNFVGFLRNVFLVATVRITYNGESQKGAARLLNYSYAVPLESSFYNLASRNGEVKIPFHGTFTASAETFQLVGLTVMGDEVPAESDLCTVETELSYQTVRGPDVNTLIPAGFVLSMGSRRGSVFTQSTAAYTGCREFRGESTLRFDIDESTAPAPKETPIIEELPEHKLLSIEVTTPIDDTASYTGDPVEGVLRHNVKLKENGAVIAKGAKVYGIITELISHASSDGYCSLRIEFERLAAGKTTYLFRANHVPVDSALQTVPNGMRGPLPREVAAQLATGSFIFAGRHLRKEGNWYGDWETVKREKLPAKPGR